MPGLSAPTRSPPRSAYPWYLASSSLWMGGMSLQGFLFTWLLVGVLEIAPDRTGLTRSIAELPPLVMLLLGGVLGDRINGRSYLASMHLLMCLPPLLVALVFELGLLSYWWVVLFGLLMSAIQALSDPARQAVLSRVARFDAQRAVTLMTLVTSLVGVGGVAVGGQLENLGLTPVLAVQALLFGLGVFAVWRLPQLPVGTGRRRAKFAAGMRAVWRLRLIRNVIGLNFLSGLFNAGAYVVVIPFIVKDVYAGGAGLYSWVVILFTIGGIGSSLILLAFMPLRRPGRHFLTMQLSRVLILLVIWSEPPLWLFYAALVAWGVNAGVTTTLARSIVQELAPPDERAQILSILLLSFMAAAPISSLLLGQTIERFSPLSALLPGVAVSLVIFGVGVARSGLWGYESAHGPRLGHSR